MGLPTTLAPRLWCGGVAGYVVSMVMGFPYDSRSKLSLARTHYDFSMFCQMLHIPACAAYYVKWNGNKFGMTLNYFELKWIFKSSSFGVSLVPIRHVPLHRSIKHHQAILPSWTSWRHFYQAVHVDPSAKFLETSSVLHRDFRKFDQKQMPGGPNGPKGQDFRGVEMMRRDFFVTHFDWDFNKDWDFHNGGWVFC